MIATAEKVKKATLGRVYVADDEYITKDMLVHLIKDAGWEVVGSSCDSEDAVKQIPKQNVDVAILDIRFPEGPHHGVEIAKAIRRYCDTEVVFLTAFGDPDTCAAAEAVDPAGYLEKPINSLVELGPLMTKAVARREFNRANGERLQLIERRGKQGLSPEEAGRLDHLQRSTTAYLEQYHSPDTTVVDSILERARKVLK